MEKSIFRDDHIVVTEQADGFYIETLKPGKSLTDFYALLKQFPNIEVTNYLTVKKALTHAPFGPELFGAAKERVVVEISEDNLEARVTLNIPKKDFQADNRRNLVMEVMDALRMAGVNYGIMLEKLRGDLKCGDQIVIAEGIPPVNGKDSKVKMYQIQEPKPQIVDNGSVNHYDLNLIHQVQTGDWLGERIDPIPGVPGKSVLGREIKPVDGIYIPLPHDPESVEMVREDGKDVLYSLKTGAVYYLGDSIAVYDVMEVDGDVDFNTGNIDFSGYVTIKGSIEENFTVRAEKDIEILGEYGIGGISTVESTGGNIYIRGGVAGKNKAKIICKKNLYVKYLSDVEVVCEGNVYVGYYIRNANIKAKQVIVDSPRGQIVGGIVETDIRVECAEIGNRMENRTKIVVRGFNRSILQSKMDELSNEILVKKEQLLKLKHLIQNQSDKKAKGAYVRKTRQAMRTVQNDIRSLEGERLSVMNYMRTPGEGAVIVRKRIFQKVSLVIQGVTLEIPEETMAPTYIVKDGSIITT